MANCSHAVLTQGQEGDWDTSSPWGAIRRRLLRSGPGQAQENTVP